MDTADARILERNAVLGLWKTGNRVQKDETENATFYNFICGNFEKVLESPEAQTFLKTTQIDSSSLTAIVQNNVENFFSEENVQDGDRLLKEFELMAVGISCLQLFVQNNWIGPVTEQILPATFLSTAIGKDIEEHMYSELGLDGEAVVYRLSRHVIYLYLARCILLDCRQYLQSLQTARWWLMRCLAIQQELLDDKSPTLKAAVLELMDDIIKTEPLMTDDHSRNLNIVFHIEAGNLCHIFYEYRKANDHYVTAKKMSALKVELTGALGKRTKWQVEEKAQLVLEVKREDNSSLGTQMTNSVDTAHHSTSHCLNSSDSGKPTNCCVPKNLELDDEDRLNRIDFTDSDRSFTPDLTPVELVLLLGLLEDHRRTRALERLLEEEIEAYVTCILNHPISWCAQEAALLMRSKIEKNSRRTVERSMNQLEELTTQLQRIDPPARQRLDFIYAVKIPPVWIIQKELASLLISLGAIGSALQIYERLHLWEDVIKCYQRIGKKEIAENIIRDQLAIKVTPDMLCYLGDVTGDKAHYEAAWELSNQKSARAMRCLAYDYFRNEDYGKSMDCFQKSLDINCLQVAVWFTYGCVCMAAEQFKVAVNAFKHCVNLDYDNFEAWNNLSAAHIKLNDQPKAFLTLKEALKCSYDNWRVWENYLIVCVDIGEFGEAVHAYNRLLDLKDKYVDVEILKIFIRIINEDIADVRGKPSSQMRDTFIKLLERITSVTTTNGYVWKLYAELIRADGYEQENLSNRLEYLQKAQRCFTQMGRWEKDVAKCREITDNSLELARLYLQCSGQEQSSAESLQMLSSAKLMLRGIISKLKQHHMDPITQSLSQDVQQLCNSLDAELNVILDKIDEIKAL